MTIVTTPFGIGITFECGYPMGITLESDPYTVTDVDISGTQSGTGSLDGGFELTVGGGEEHKVMLGGVLEVTATWSITTLTDVSFYFDRCGVVHGSQNVNVIQGRAQQHYVLTMPVRTVPHLKSEVGIRFCFQSNLRMAKNLSDPIQSVPHS